MTESRVTKSSESFNAAREHDRSANGQHFGVEWLVNGTTVTTGYPADVLFGPAREDESITFFEWLLRSLQGDGFTHLTVRPR